VRCAAGHAVTPDELDLAVRRPRRHGASSGGHRASHPGSAS
jgi:hypothetical protein